MGWIGWIIIGALAGWIGSKIMGTDEKQGALGNIIVGIIGGVIGGLVMNMIGGAGVTGFNPWSLGVATLGSVILIAVLKAFKK